MFQKSKIWIVSEFRLLLNHVIEVPRVDDWCEYQIAATPWVHKALHYPMGKSNTYVCQVSQTDSFTNIKTVTHSYNYCRKLKLWLINCAAFFIWRRLRLVSFCRSKTCSVWSLKVRFLFVKFWCLYSRLVAPKGPELAHSDYWTK